MINRYTLLLAPLMLATLGKTATAQTTAEATTRYEAQRQKILNNQAADKTSANDISRMTGAAHSEYSGGNFVIKDTSRLNYTGSRGQNVNLDPWLLGNNGDFSLWLYDEEQQYGPTGKVWQRNTQEFDANDNITKRYTERYNTPQAKLVPFEQKVYTYTANKLATEVGQTWLTAQGQMQNKTFDNYIYNSSNQLIVVDNQNWNVANSAWQDIYKYTYSYNGNLMSESEIGYWDVLTSTLTPNTKNTYTYNGNLLAQDLTERYYNKQWNKYAEKTLSYSGTDATMMELKTWNTTTSNFDLFEKHIYTYDANHNMLTDVLAQYDAGTSTYYDKRKTTYTYNSFNQVLTEASQQWDGSQWVNDYFSGDLNINNRFYYEVFNTNIKDAVNDTPSITVYPSPASYMITVHSTFEQPQPFNVIIYNAAGIPVKQWPEQPTANYTKDVQIAELPAGQYFLKIIGDNVNRTAQLTCIK